MSEVTGEPAKVPEPNYASLGGMFAAAMRPRAYQVLARKACEVAGKDVGGFEVLVSLVLTSGFETAFFWSVILSPDEQICECMATTDAYDGEFFVQTSEIVAINLKVAEHG